MKFALEIDCNNAAFDDDVSEVVDILNHFAIKLASERPPIGARIFLRDINGNRVGFAQFIEDTNAC
jgi:hypothetical protein